MITLLLLIIAIALIIIAVRLRRRRQLRRVMIVNLAAIIVGLKLGQRADAEILMKPQHFLRPQPGYGQHLEDAGRNLLP
jgi:hypothetical protein